MKRRLDILRVECLYAVRSKMLRKTVEDPPIVIAGCGHSGTTLLLSILDAHSRIFAIPYEAKLGKGSLSDLREKVETFNKLTLAHGKSRWVEKTPANVYYLDHLFENVPDLKVLVMVRDGRDVACSMRVRLQQTLGSSESAFAKGISRWTDENLQWLRHQAHPRLLMVKYEDLVTCFDSTVRKVLGFLDEEFEPQVVDFHLSKKNYLHHSKVDVAPEPTQEHINEFRNWQVHQPLFDGTGRWQYEMSEDEKHLFKESAGDLLIRLGYSHDFNW